MTKAKTERLAILVEECGEVIQIAMKILRHGEDSFSPLDKTKTGNMQLLEKELGDVMFAIRMMTSHYDVSLRAIEERVFEKKMKIKPYLHAQENVAFCNTNKKDEPNS